MVAANDRVVRERMDGETVVIIIRKHDDKAAVFFAMGWAGRMNAIATDLAA
jgi:hypothetical protein